MSSTEALKLPRLNRGNEVRRDTSWAADAACIGRDDEKGAPVFFSDERRDLGAGRYRVADPDEEAKAICAGCPVRSSCLEYALAKPERYGVWGGMGERERERLLRNLSSARRPS